MIFFCIYLAGIPFVAFSIWFILLIDNHLAYKDDWLGIKLLVSLNVIETHAPFCGGYFVNKFMAIAVILVYPLFVAFFIVRSIAILIFMPFDKLAQFIASKIK